MTGRVLPLDPLDFIAKVGFDRGWKVGLGSFANRLAQEKVAGGA